MNSIDNRRSRTVQTDPDPVVIKLEQKNVAAQKIIQNLENRAGPIYVDENTSRERSTSISPVLSEVTQKDDSFAQNYTFTTNVSLFLLIYSV